MFAGLMGIECHSSSVRHRCEVTEGKTPFVFVLLELDCFPEQRNSNNSR